MIGNILLNKILKNLCSGLVLLSLVTVANGAEIMPTITPKLPDTKITVDGDVPNTPKIKPDTSIVKKLKQKKRLKNNAVNYADIPEKTNFAAEIEMFVGETRVIKEPNAGRLAVGSGSTLSAAVLDDKEILLIANDVGVSSLHIWTHNGKNRRLKVNVVPGDTSRVSKEVTAFLKTIPNAKASLIGDKVIVEGDNLSDVDLAKIEELSKRYPQIINFTNRLGWEKMISMDVRVVEFPSKYLREVGLKWGTTGGAAVGAVWSPIRYNNDGPFQINQATGATNAPPISGALGSPLVLPRGLNILSVLNAGFNAQLNLMVQDGSAVMLARPSLSTRSGTKANFLAGGEIPYSVSNINGTTIVFKPYGIKLEIEPKVDRNGIIRAKILSEVSEVDSGLSTLAGPALLSRKTESEFNVQQGETIVLSGLLKRNKSTTVDKLPLLGDIPILGALFRSKRYQNDETELVVFVTPVAVDKHAETQQDNMDKTNLRLNEEFTPNEMKNKAEHSPNTENNTSEPKPDNLKTNP